MIRFWNWFVKITGWPAQALCFRTKVYYEDRSVQDRHIRGPALVISNHTSIVDYMLYLFVFFTRTVRFQMAEVLFRKKFLGWLLRRLGGIYVDRNAKDFGFLTESLEILENGGAVGMFPESRLPLPGEARPLEFKVSAAWLALAAGVPVIPVVTNGSYCKRARARVLIGKPFYAADLAPEGGEEKETLQLVSERMRQIIIDLENLLDEQTKT